MKFGTSRQPLRARLLPLVMAVPAATAEDDPIADLLEDAHKKFKGVKEGKNADYIPALAEVPSKLFGISLVTVDGKVYDQGDTKSLFSIQSISKVFTLALALQESGEQAIEDNIGVDATGQVFNSIVAVEQHGLPAESFVNPGAIARPAW
jgi:glutaminase